MKLRDFYQDRNYVEARGVLFVHNKDELLAGARSVISNPWRFLTDQELDELRQIIQYWSK